MGIKIAIDGKAGTGKSTIAKDIAKTLGFTHIDSGGFYRVVTLFCLKNNIAIPPKHFAFLNNMDITQDELGNMFLNKQNVTHDIRSMEISAQVSNIATLREVRDFVNRKLRHIGKTKHIVVDGRDIGTYVFPDAEVKCYVTASIEARAKRRFDELKANGEKTTLSGIKLNLEQRDKIDSQRAISPLKKAADAIEIDTSHLNKKEQLELFLNIIKEKIHT